MSDIRNIMDAIKAGQTVDLQSGQVVGNVVFAPSANQPPVYAEHDSGAEIERLRAINRKESARAAAYARQAKEAKEALGKEVDKRFGAVFYCNAFWISFVVNVLFTTLFIVLE